MRDRVEPSNGLQAASVDDIVNCYRLILGREPDAEGLRQYVEAHLPIDVVVRSFINSPEYRTRSENLKAVTLYGIEFVVRASETMYEGDYEPYVFDHLMAFLGPGKTFLDVGSNIGVFAIHAAKRGTDVIAIEARSSNSALLLENARRNRVSIELHPLAVSDRRGYAVLDVASENENAAIRRHEAACLGDQIVALTLLDEIVDERHIDAMKIDVEGHEYRALRGAEKMLSKSRPVIVSEYSPDYQQVGSGVSGATYLRFLQSFGYRASVLDRSGVVTPVNSDSLFEQLDERCRLAGHHVDLLLEP
jgi:FkbM family methyltransferase